MKKRATSDPGPHGPQPLRPEAIIRANIAATETRNEVSFFLHPDVIRSFWEMRLINPNTPPTVMRRNTILKRVPMIIWLLSNRLVLLPVGFGGSHATGRRTGAKATWTDVFQWDCSQAGLYPAAGALPRVKRGSGPRAGEISRRKTLPAVGGGLASRR